jgi:hypothetical protein
VTGEQIAQNGGHRLLVNVYGSSPALLLRTVYPEHQWLPWKFSLVSAGYWEKRENAETFLRWLASELQFKNWEDWYNIRGDQVVEHDGGGFLRKYNNNPIRMLQSVFPSYPWLPWKFFAVPDGYWKNKENQKQFLDWLAPQLQIRTWEDWYSVTGGTIAQHGGRWLLQDHYDNSVPALLSSVYPNYPWLPWGFANPGAAGLWEDVKTIRKYCDWLIELRQLEGPQALAGKTETLVRQHYGRTLLNRFSLKQILQLAYAGTNSPIIMVC